MAKNTQPIAKRCKALGISPVVMGYNKKETTRNSNTQNRRKKSEYATQLQEKQKVKFIYGVLEKQFLGFMKRRSVCPARPATTCSSSLRAAWTTSCSASATPPPRREEIGRAHV